MSLSVPAKAQKAFISPATRRIVLARVDSTRCACGCGRPTQPTYPAAWHHIFPKQRHPELIDEPDNLILVAITPCHANHESAYRRLPRKVAWRAERLAVTPAMEDYLTRTYGPREE